MYLEPKWLWCQCGRDQQIPVDFRPHATPRAAGAAQGKRSRRARAPSSEFFLSTVTVGSGAAGATLGRLQCHFEKRRGRPCSSRSVVLASPRLFRGYSGGAPRCPNVAPKSTHGCPGALQSLGHAPRLRLKGAAAVWNAMKVPWSSGQNVVPHPATGQSAFRLTLP